MEKKKKNGDFSVCYAVLLGLISISEKIYCNLFFFLIIIVFLSTRYDCSVGFQKRHRKINCGYFEPKWLPSCSKMVLIRIIEPIITLLRESIFTH